MDLTFEKLRSMRACSGRSYLFKAIFPEGANFTRQNAREAMSRGFTYTDLCFLTGTFLKGSYKKRWEAFCKKNDEFYNIRRYALAKKNLDKKTFEFLLDKINDKLDKREWIAAWKYWKEQTS